MRLQVANSTTTMYYSVTNAVPAKPYLPIASGANTYYLPLTTATLAGVKLKVQSGNATYRACIYQSGYYNTTSAAVGNLSSTTALTRASTSATLTRASTSATLTRASTSATLTRASTSATLTRASTSATLTRASTSATLTRASTSATYTRASTSATLTRSSISGYATISDSFTKTVTNYRHGSGNYLENISLSAFPVTSIKYISGGKTGSLLKMNKYNGVNGTSYFSYGVGQVHVTNSTDIRLELPYNRWTAYGYMFRYADGGAFTQQQVFTEFHTFTNGNTVTRTSSRENTKYTDYGGFDNGAYQVSMVNAITMVPGGGYRVMSYTNGTKNTAPVYANTTQNFGVSSLKWSNDNRAYTMRNYFYALSEYPRTGTWTYEVYNGAAKAGTVTGSSTIYMYEEISVIGTWYSGTDTYSGTSAKTTATLTRSSISGYGTRSSISGYGTRSSISGYGTRSSISGYATRSSISGYQTRSSISGYGTRSSISGYGTRSSISGYGTRSSISGYSGKLSSSKWA